MMPSKTYLESLRNALHSIFEKDEKVILVGEDILDPYGGAFKVTKGLSTKFPNRVITTPICEASIVGLGIGLALRGFKPIVEIMFGDFITIAADQIINHAAKFELMYGGGVKVPLVIRTPVGAGRGYGPTHSQSLEKLFLGIPNLGIVAPSHFHNPGIELIQAINDEKPILFIENKTLYSLPLKPTSSKLYIEEISDQTCKYTTVIVRNYSSHYMQADVVIITYGGISRFLEKLFEKLAEEEIWVLAVLPSCISAPSLDIMASHAKRSGRVVLIEEGHIGFGWCSEIAQRLYSLLFNNMKAPIQIIGANPTIIPASYELEQLVIVNEEKIENAIIGILS